MVVTNGGELTKTVGTKLFSQNPQFHQYFHEPEFACQYHEIKYVASSLRH